MTGSGDVRHHWACTLCSAACYRNGGDLTVADSQPHVHQWIMADAAGHLTIGETEYKNLTVAGLLAALTGQDEPPQP